MGPVTVLQKIWGNTLDVVFVYIMLELEKNYVKILVLNPPVWAPTPTPTKRKEL